MIFSSSITDQIIFSLDRCAPHWELEVCRILYNKPIVISSLVTGRFFEAFSAENLFNALHVPFISMLVIPTYIGILSLTVSSAHSWKWILYMWLLIYTLLVMDKGLTKEASLLAAPLFTFLAIRGVILTKRMLTHYATQR